MGDDFCFSFMKFDIFTIFPHIFDFYFNTSILKRAQEKKQVLIKIHDIRAWAEDKYKTVDDRPYGGGPGMILKVDPIYRALKRIKKSPLKANLSMTEKVILLTPKGKQFDQKMAKRLTKFDRIILLCGRYEGVDERVIKFVDEQISVGPYVLSGGELPAMILVDAIARLVPGVIKNESLKEESFSMQAKSSELKAKNIEYPQYTRPEVFTYKDASGKIRSLKVPNVLLSGDHKKIKQWRDKHVR